MLTVPSLLAAILIVASLVGGCSPEQKRYVANVGDGYTTPTMATLDVSTLISDSGYTRYHLTSPLWQMFEDAEEPFWRFPEGLELQQYDLSMQPTANVVCDTAIYYSRKRIWKLDGNVVMVNTEADSFLTQELFWDQNKKKIYSDSFIHIVRTDRIIEGYGFESDQSMRYYTVNHPTAILPVEHRTMANNTEVDTIASDSVSEEPRSPRRHRQRPSEAARQAKDDTSAVIINGLKPRRLAGDNIK